MQISALPVPMVLTAPNSDNKTSTNQSGFGEQLNKAIDQLNQIQLKSEETKLQFVTGEIQDIHQVTIAMQEAKIAMSIAVEVRNKVVEAYQEVSRMPL
jgi:flagellar hook-basal body complex protein FliE